MKEKKEKFSIVIIPYKGKKTYSFEISKYLSYSIAIFICFCIINTVFSFFVVKENFLLKKEIKISREYLKQINFYAETIQKYLLKIQEKEVQFKTIAGIEVVKEEKESGKTGMGGVELNNEKSFVEKIYNKFLALKIISGKRLQNYSQIEKVFLNQKTLLDTTPSIMPVKGIMTRGFGTCLSPFTGLKEIHRGVDISAPVNTPIIATANGIVIGSGYNNGMGNYIKLQHNDKYSTLYGHNQKNLVKVGQRVKRGQIIAYVGSTGHSTGPHVHYEVRINNTSLNPYFYMLNFYK